MSDTNSEINYLNRIILEVINERKPQSVRQLTKLVKESIDLTEEKILESVLKLQADGVIKFTNQPIRCLSIATYLKTGDAVWYWMTIAAGTLTTALVFTISESAFPWIYARNFLGVIFVFFLPGFALMKTLFPRHISSESRSSGPETIERVALSVGLSIALISIVGLILYYSQLSLNLNTIVFSIFGLTLIFATTAVIKGYQTKK